MKFLKKFQVEHLPKQSFNCSQLLLLQKELKANSWSSHHKFLSKTKNRRKPQQINVVLSFHLNRHELEANPNDNDETQLKTGGYFPSCVNSELKIKTRSFNINCSGVFIPFSNASTKILKQKATMLTFRLRSEFKYQLRRDFNKLC